MADTQEPRNDTEKQVPPPKKKKKNNFTVMDYITIGFTVVIVLIMAFILLRTIRPDWFGLGEKNSESSATLPAFSTAQNTEPPTLSDLGNSYGNMTNDPAVREIGGRLYTIDTAEDRSTAVFVEVDGKKRELLRDSASCLNVISDPITYREDTNASAYTVLYLDADGNICCFTDGPVYENQPFSSVTAEKRILSAGKFRQITVRGEYLFFLDEAGHIGKMSLTEQASEILSKETYSCFAVTGTNLYALHEDDQTLYLLSTVARPKATAAPEETASVAPGTSPVPGVDEYETQIISEKITHFCTDGNRLYLATENGVFRYTPDGTGKDQLTDRAASRINVQDDKIICLSGETLYAGTASELLIGRETTLGTVSGVSGISTTGSGVYVFSTADGKLLGAVRDTGTGSYGTLA